MTKILFAPTGIARFIHSDLAEAVAREVGTVTIRRVSHVEPAPGGGWGADMGPVSGPVLGPYRTRGEALQAERLYLESCDVPIPRGTKCLS